ncbi:MAG: hypothetical protein AMJ79_01200 [Phycisphaerae bacterium SM23_30]|nr:MAG: hypothetical protein AMJ79_01200 [Phycisphaerae bacterium SM23_30]
MKKNIYLAVIWLFSLLSVNAAYAFQENPAAWWKFDQITDKSVFDKASGQRDVIKGTYFRSVDGVSGKAIKLDGFTSYVLRPGKEAPTIKGAFSVEGWFALGAYPTHWCPIVMQGKPSNSGFFLGVNARGRVGFKLFAGSEWQAVQSDEMIPLRKWTHLAGIYNGRDEITLYADGKTIASKKIQGEFIPAKGSDLLIGKHSIMRKPDGTIRPHATADVYTFFDGIIDELKLFNRSLDSGDIAAEFARFQPTEKPDLPLRPLPFGPPGPGKFGAYYTTLKYYEGWDAPWRVADHADVIVRFDESACRFVFWRGTSYVPHWVTENGICFDNGFLETWNDKGCCEPMSDKQCRHSHVRIIESNDARVVVHWRYALVDNWYNFALIDENTGWGDWADEVFTIYRDMIGVRAVTLQSAQPTAPHEWHESIVVLGPGQRPDEVLDLEALTLANIQGETYTYSWADRTPTRRPRQPKGANIQLINTQSEYKTFTLVRPQDDPSFDIYAGEIRRDVCVFPWWNHWPTAPKPSDGRYAMADDLASHASLTHIYWGPYRQTETSMTKIQLMGMTNESAERLVPLARSWSNPPEIKVAAGDYNFLGYEAAERAYIFDTSNKNKPGDLTCEIVASAANPIYNIALVINGWGDGGAVLKLNGNIINQGKNFRVGHRAGLEDTALIVWIKHESTKPVKITLNRAGNNLKGTK